MESRHVRPHVSRRRQALAGAAGVCAAIAFPFVLWSSSPALAGRSDARATNERLAFTALESAIQLYGVKPDGTDVRRLLVSASVDWAPVMAPDGKHVAFVSSRAGNDDIYVVGEDGIKKLTHDAGDDFDPAWSPDSTRIAFASSRGGDVDLYAMIADGSQVKRLTATKGDDEVRVGRRTEPGSRSHRVETTTRTFS